MENRDALIPPMSDWRKHLKRLMDEQKLDMKGLSVRAGLDPSAVFKIFDRSGNPQISTVSALAKALGVSLDTLFYGVVADKAEVQYTPIAGEVAAGVWMEQDAWDAEKYAPVPVVPSRYPGLPQKAWHIVGNSMDLAGIGDGFVVITVDYWAVRSAPTDSDIVIVERRRGGLVERTCKEIVVRPGEYELRPRSSDARHKPIVIKAGNHDGEDGTEIEIVGKVIWASRAIA